MRRHPRALLCALAGAAAPLAPAALAQDPALVRGPYLQRGAPTGAVVRWRTSVPTGTWLAWGESANSLELQVSDPEPGLEHEVALGGLDPDRWYYYAVGDTAGPLAGPGPDYRFRTPPLAGAARPLRVWAIGDSGLATAAQAAVRDAYLADAAGAATDVWLMLGDNAYDSGADGQYTDSLFAPYAELLRATFVWPSFGNHDALSADAATGTGPYFEAFSLPALGESGGLASGTEAYYSFDWGAVHFVALDSAESSLAAGAPMLAWLAADLAANALPWTVAFLHHPPYTKGSHDSDDPADSGGRMIAVRENALGILEGAGVDLVLAGHSHSYERSLLLDGHYGDSSTFDPATMALDAGDGDPAGDGPYLKSAGGHQGAVYVVAGSAALLGSGALDHPAMARGLAEHGALVLEVDGDRIAARFLDDYGFERDRFALVKPGVPLFADGFESGTTGAWPARFP